MFRKRKKKKTGKMCNVYWCESYTQTFLSYFFIFTSFNTSPLILLLNVVLVRDFKLVKSD